TMYNEFSLNSVKTAHFCLLRCILYNVEGGIGRSEASMLQKVQHREGIGHYRGCHWTSSNDTHIHIAPMPRKSPDWATIPRKMLF
ncbi:hypothetical protein, partial [Paenibacillus chondroitinus]|uniref:hypothetical protein n=1 Tax=Paenibacillus chondroitinus TaxID=59842 RepID=UPI001C3FB52B